MKKVFIVFLVFAYLNCYLGCYSSKTITIPIEELQTKSKEFEVTFDDLSLKSKKSDISFDELVHTTNEYSLSIMTKDLEYLFDAKTYQLLNDTLYGFTRLEDRVQKVKISKSEILLISIGKNNWLNNYNNLDISLVLKDSAYYSFKGGDYFLIGDFLVGEGFKKTYAEYEIYDNYNRPNIEKSFYKIPINQIDLITGQSSEFSAGNTVLLIIGSSIMAFAIFIAAIAISYRTPM